jgi:hypothetical protein
MDDLAETRQEPQPGRTQPQPAAFSLVFAVVIRLD